jgi:hypothetical protein
MQRCLRIVMQEALQFVAEQSGLGRRGRHHRAKRPAGHDGPKNSPTHGGGPYAKAMIVLRSLDYSTARCLPDLVGHPANDYYSW